MMNPGPAEEVGKATGSFMTIMKEQPLSLALVVMNLALLALLYYVAQGAASTREREVALLYASQKEIQEILSHCVVPGQPPR